MIYPTDLTTSDWVDCLAGKPRDEQIAILATYHRRIELAASKAALDIVTDIDPVKHAIVRKAVGDAVAALDASPLGKDYAASSAEAVNA